MTTFNYTRLASLDSTAIDLIAYDDKSETMLVRFADGGRDYVYSDIPDFVYDGMTAADSAGHYFQDEVSGLYSSIRSDEPLTLVERVRDISTAPSAVDVTKAEDVTDAVVSDLTALVEATNQNYYKYGVKWSTQTMNIGPFEASYQATDELDALLQFHLAVGEFGVEDVKILAVVHYFE